MLNVALIFLVNCDFKVCDFRVDNFVFGCLNRLLSELGTLSYSLISLYIWLCDFMWPDSHYLIVSYQVNELLPRKEVLVDPVLEIGGRASSSDALYWGS